MTMKNRPRGPEVENLEKFQIQAKVKSIKGICPFGYKLGDKIVFNGRSIEGNICYSALNAFFSKIYAVSFGLDFPWSREGITDMVCPDPVNPVVFEVRRIAVIPGRKGGTIAEEVT